MNLFLTSINSLRSIFLVVAIILLLLLYLAWKRTDNRSNDKFEALFLKIREEIKFSVVPKFIDLSVSVNELVDLSIEIWRIEQRINKSASNFPENQLTGLENSIQKLRRYLDKSDIQIIDYKNQKFNEGLNLDILSIEKDSSISESIIKETVEPTIMYKGQLIRKAKIILLSNN